MAGRKARIIVAKPLSITLTKEYYVLRIRIIEGPEGFLDRVVRLNLTSKQMDLISGWEPIAENERLDFDLGNIIVPE